MYSSAFLDQLTKHQGIDSACNTVIDSLPDEFCHTYITAMAGSVILNPGTGCCFQAALQHTQDFTDRDLICRLAKLVTERFVSGKVIMKSEGNTGN